MLECVVNISEGRRPDVIAAVAGAAGTRLLDVHTDPDHNRSVLTLAVDDPTDDDEAVRAVTVAAIARIDLRHHVGAHPRIGVVDVVPFAALPGSTMRDAVAARDRFARWAGAELSLPCFLYGPERSLPDVRRQAFTSLPPDTGPAEPHPTGGACAVGARPVLVAYNVWLVEPDIALARRIAAELRSQSVRALGLTVGGQVQVSMNLIAPEIVGPEVVFDAVAGKARVDRAELVGLIPRAVLTALPKARWGQLDLDDGRTIEARLEVAGLT